MRMGVSRKVYLGHNTRDFTRHALAISREDQALSCQINPHAYPVSSAKRWRRLPITQKLVAITQESLGVVKPGASRANNAPVTPLTAAQAKDECMERCVGSRLRHRRRQQTPTRLRGPAQTSPGGQGESGRG